MADVVRDEPPWGSGDVEVIAMCEVRGVSRVWFDRLFTLLDENIVVSIGERLWVIEVEVKLVTKKTIVKVDEKGAVSLDD